jgi:hypothetical protein
MLLFLGAETVGRKEQLPDSREKTPQGLDGHLLEIPDALNVLQLLKLSKVFHGIDVPDLSGWRRATAPSSLLTPRRRIIARGGVSRRRPHRPWCRISVE